MQAVYGVRIPWNQMDVTSVWACIAITGAVLDGTISFLLAADPPQDVKVTFPIVIFHTFTLFTMSAQIGYAFPCVCIASCCVFMDPGPFNSTSSIVGRLTCLIGTRGGFTGCAALLYILVQLVLPLRMPFVSDNEYPRTREGYRWSWTMVLHATSTVLTFEDSGIDVMQLHPMCKGRPLNRQSYAPDLQRSAEWSLAFPKYDAFRGRSAIYLTGWPRLLPGVAASISKGLSPLCPGSLAVHATWFVELNGNRVFSRLVDPRVDLVRVERTLRSRSTPEMLWNVFTDRPPASSEHILRNSGMITAAQIVSFGHAVRHSTEFDPYFLVDRSAFLLTPLHLHISTKTSVIYVRVLISPVPLSVSLCQDRLGKCESHVVRPGRFLKQNIGVHSIEIAATSAKNTTAAREDVVLALAWRAAVRSRR